MGRFKGYPTPSLASPIWRQPKTRRGQDWSILISKTVGPGREGLKLLSMPKPDIVPKLTFIFYF